MLVFALSVIVGGLGAWILFEGVLMLLWGLAQLLRRNPPL